MDWAQKYGNGWGRGKNNRYWSQSAIQEGKITKERSTAQGKICLVAATRANQEFQFSALSDSKSIGWHWANVRNCYIVQILTTNRRSSNLPQYRIWKNQCSTFPFTIVVHTNMSILCLFLCFFTLLLCFFTIFFSSSKFQNQFATQSCF